MAGPLRNNCTVELSSTVRQTDVLFECEEEIASSHPGNIEFERVVSNYRKLSDCLSKRNRVAIGYAVVRDVQEKGGRFLQPRREGVRKVMLWKEVPLISAVFKTVAALENQKRTDEMTSLDETHFEDEIDFTKSGETQCDLKCFDKVHNYCAEETDTGDKHVSKTVNETSPYWADEAEDLDEFQDCLPHEIIFPSDEDHREGFMPESGWNHDDDKSSLRSPRKSTEFRLYDGNSLDSAKFSVASGLSSYVEATRAAFDLDLPKSSQFLVENLNSPFIDPPSKKWQISCNRSLGTVTEDTTILLGDSLASDCSVENYSSEEAPPRRSRKWRRLCASAAKRLRKFRKNRRVDDVEISPCVNGSNTVIAGTW